MDNPRLRTPLILSLLAICAALVAYRVYEKYGDDLIITGALVLFVLVFVVATVATGIDWLVYRTTNRMEDLNRARAVTPALEMARALQRLTPEQTELMGINNYYYQMAILPTESGPRYFLPTPLGPIPREILERELRAASMIHLAAIRNYPDKSQERADRKLFTDWCCLAGHAYPANGNEPARWVDPGKTRLILAGRLGIRLYGEQEASDDTE